MHWPTSMRSGARPGSKFSPAIAAGLGGASRQIPTVGGAHLLIDDVSEVNAGKGSRLRRRGRRAILTISGGRRMQCESAVSKFSWPASSTRPLRHEIFVWRVTAARREVGSIRLASADRPDFAAFAAAAICVAIKLIRCVSTVGARRCAHRSAQDGGKIGADENLAAALRDAHCVFHTSTTALCTFAASALLSIAPPIRCLRPGLPSRRQLRRP